MNTDTILRLLQNSGFYNVRVDADFVYVEDPSCLLRNFDTFIDTAWLAIAVITGIMLTGWAISMIRGARNDIFTNLRNLIIIFGVLSVVKPILNFIYVDDLFSRGCRTISAPMSDVQELLDARNRRFGIDGESELYEVLNIYDTGVVKSAPGANVPRPDTVATTDAPTLTAPTPDAKIVPISQGAAATRATNIANVPVSATADSRDVIYTMPDGARVRRSGGTRAWRNSNPGNIRYSEFARRVGAIGTAGGFAVFPDEATGMYAIEALLRTDSYNKITVAGAISRYAPPSENDTAAYHRKIEQLTGLSINKRMSDLTQYELTRVATAIRQIEGWRPGTEQRI